MYHEQIKNILKKIKGDFFDFEENLLTDGYISSFDLMGIIAEVQTTFEIKIPMGEISPQNFNSVSGICEIVEKYKK